MHSPWGFTEARWEQGWVSLLGASCLVSLFLQARWTSWSRKQLLSNVSAVSSGEITWLEARFMHQRMLFLQNTGLYHLLGRAPCNPNALIENCDTGGMFKKESTDRSVAYLWLRLKDGCVWARWLFPCWKWLTAGYKPLQMFQFRAKKASGWERKKGDYFCSLSLLEWRDLRMDDYPSGGLLYFQPSFNTTYTPNQGLMEHLENSSRCDMLVLNVYSTLEYVIMSK